MITLNSDNVAVETKEETIDLKALEAEKLAIEQKIADAIKNPTITIETIIDIKKLEAQKLALEKKLEITPEYSEEVRDKMIQHWINIAQSRIEERENIQLQIVNLQDKINQVKEL
jgi:hypothetical protein